MNHEPRNSMAHWKMVRLWSSGSPPVECWYARDRSQAARSGLRASSLLVHQVSALSPRDVPHAEELYGHIRWAAYSG
jgi:hypothetical protein